MKKILILITFSLLWIRGLTQNTKILRIDPKYARGGVASQIFDSVTYTPLETTKESMFGDINNLQVSRHYFAFYDYDTKSIFIFGRQEKFYAKITQKDLGRHYVSGQFFSGMDKFTLNIFSENIFIVYDDGASIDNTKKLAVFSPYGKLLQSKNLNPLFHNLETSFSLIDSSRALFSSEKGDTVSSYCKRF